MPNPYFGIIPRSSSLGDPTITVAQLMKPYPEYTTVSRYRNNVGDHALPRARAESRTAAVARALVLDRYTRSRLMDDASSVFDASILTGPIANYPVADSFNRTLERDYSTGDIPHLFVVVGGLGPAVRRGPRAPDAGRCSAPSPTTGRSPSLVTLQSGVPVAVTQTTNSNAFAGFGVQRPNLVGDPTLPADQRTAAQWFDTAAFAVAPQFTHRLGVAQSRARPVVPQRRHGAHPPDSRPRRARRLEIRAEAFNLFNTTNLGTPNAVLGAANFGTITTAFDPRVLQLAVKFLLVRIGASPL